MLPRYFTIHLTRLDRVVSDYRETLRLEEHEFEKHQKLLRQRFEERMSALEAMVADRNRKATNILERMETIAEDLGHAAEEHIRKELSKAEREMKRLQRELDAARAGGGAQAAAATIDLAEQEAIKKASTLAIFDSIIFAMSNWSTDGDTAPDFELTCQAALFPTIYERVMKGESDYYVTEVPPAADVVVERGREYVKHFRTILPSSLVTSDAWNEHASSIQQWWVRDALPLIYGARADEWDDDVGLTLDEALEWRDQPASRALHFPLIFDGMELVEKYRDQIRESTGLPDFNKRTLQTRLQP